MDICILTGWSEALVTLYINILNVQALLVLSAFSLYQYILNTKCSLALAIYNCHNM